MSDMFIQAAKFLARMAEESANPFSGATIMEPWITDFIDVPGIHTGATQELQSLINKVKREGRSKARLLIGDSATGKSHVLARIKNLFSDKIFFCFSEPLTGDGDNIFRHILSNIVRSLLRRMPGAGHAQFRRVWRDFFLGVAPNRPEHEKNFRAWTENRKLDFMCQLDDQLRAAGKNIDFMLVGVLYEYARSFRTNAKVRLTAENWCRGVNLNEKELEILDLPSYATIDTEDKAKEIIKSFGIITSFSRPIFLCFDQVETYLLNEKAFRAFMRAIEYLTEYTTNYAIVTSALLTFDEKLRISGLTPSTWDRFNCAKKPIMIHPLTPAEGEKLLAARLACETRLLDVFSKKNLFPFCAEDLDEILTPPGASTRTFKQARYLLADAESIFDQITAARPSAKDVEFYFKGNSSLRRIAPKTEVSVWPTSGDVAAYLDRQLEEALRLYHSNPALVGIDENRNREIVLDLLYRAGENSERLPKIVDIAVPAGKKRGGCDFVISLKAPDQAPHTVAVVFCDNPRANVIKSIVTKATQLLNSKQADTLMYVRDSRASLTQKGQALLEEFERNFASNSQKKVTVFPVDSKELHHLRAMRRLFELAASEDLTMYNSGQKKDYKLNQDHVQAYLFADNRWLDNELVMKIVSG